MVLNTHPRVLAIGEMHAPPHPSRFPEKRMCSCGSPMIECEFFTELKRRLELQPLHKLWNGDVMTRYRQGHRSRDAEQMAICEGCSVGA